MGIAEGRDNRPAMECLFAFLRRQFQISTFVETGTFRGDTALFASRHFPSVITLEGSPVLYERARIQLARCPNVQCIRGDSREQLSRIATQLQRPVLYWLDAHWSGGETFGQTAECPLLAELSAIYSSKCTPYVVIDDARFFVSLPPLPLDLRDWPSYYAIIQHVHQRAAEPFVTTFADAIVLAPQESMTPLVNYLRRPLDSPPRRSPVPTWLARWRRRAPASDNSNATRL